MEQRVVVEARVAPCSPRLGLLVQNEQVLLAHSHRRYPALSAVQPQADGVFVESHRAVEVRDSKVYGPEAERRVA
jgi:hypothetical protein